MKNYEDSLYLLECAVLNIQENARAMDYTPEALDRLKLAFADMEDLVKKYEMLECSSSSRNNLLMSGDKQRIFFDMDGTLSEWEDNPIEEVAKPGYFYNRKPVQSIINTLKELREKYDVYILSSVFVDEHSVSEKVAWNALYTGVPRAKQIYVPYGQDKNAYLEQCGGIRSNDILIDDFSYNLHKWKGIGVKVYNGVNGTKGTWKGYFVNNSSPAEEIAKKICEIARKG